MGKEVENMDMAERIKALENGNGIQFLLNSAFLILNNPLYVIDIDYNLLAFTDVPVDEPDWNELVTTGTFSAKTLERLANAGLTENIANAERTAILNNEQLKNSRIAGHIPNRDKINVGLVMMSAYITPFSPESLKAFNALVDKITEEIQAYDYFTMLAMNYYEDKINLLLDGTVKNPLIYNPHAQILYDGFEDFLYLAAIHFERKSLLENVYRNKLVYLKSMLKTKYPSFKFSVYGEYIVMLMSSTHSNFYGVPYLVTHADLFEQNGLLIGISGGFENIYELRLYFDQAVTALAKGLESGDGRRLFLHQDA